MRSQRLDSGQNVVPLRSTNQGGALMLSARVQPGVRTFVVKSKAVEEPPVASHQSTMACAGGHALADG